MNKIITAMLAASMPIAMMAQSAIDAQQISQSDLKGTARFMSMGGAFTALGGDLSTLGQNPAGIAVYRSSDLGVTLDINMQNSSTEPSYAPQFASKNSQTKVYCNNFGYVGAANLDGLMETFNWGVTFNRAVSFDRVFQGYVGSTQTSLSNYVANFTNGVTSTDMDFTKSYNPYLDSDIDWMSILAYSGYMINPIQNGGNQYLGLFQNGTVGDALYNVRETGRVDEYNISFGGNVDDVVLWGFTIGITDLDYTRTLFYSESMENAQIVNAGAGATTTVGNAGFDLNSRKYIDGNGFNIKLGVIVKPIPELRIGLAVHTPTWYNLNQGYDGTINYSYYNPKLATNNNSDHGALNPVAGNDYTENAYFPWHFRSPWKLMLGVAGVIGQQAIVSLDYQYDGFNNMGISTPVYYDGYVDGYESNGILNQDIKDYFQGTSTVRLGLEYRVTPQFSLRAGYNYQTSNVKSQAKNGQIPVYTSGTDCSYNFDKSTQYISAGLGYKYKQWYIDAAYVYKKRESSFHAYSNFNGFSAPQSKLMENNSSIVLSTGFRF